MRGITFSRVLNSSRTIANVLGGRLGGRLQETTTRKLVKLTAVQIRAPLAPGKYYDCGVFGLYLLVKPSGARSWMQRISTPCTRAPCAVTPAAGQWGCQRLHSVAGHKLWTCT